jgi:hypothetical protein
MHLGGRVAALRLGLARWCWRPRLAALPERERCHLTSDHLIFLGVSVVFFPLPLPQDGTEVSGPLHLPQDGTDASPCSSEGRGPASEPPREINENGPNHRPSSHGKKTKKEVRNTCSRKSTKRDGGTPASPLHADPSCEAIRPPAKVPPQH